MPYANANGVKVYYESHGEGPAVVLSHGAGGHHAIWWQNIPHFRDRYQVVALDLPGFGRSDALPDFDTHRYPEHILAVLDDAGLERAVLVGQSLGSPPSLKVAVDHPDRVAGALISHSIGGVDDEAILEKVRADRAVAEQMPIIDRLMSKRYQEEQQELVFLFQQLGSFNDTRVPDLKKLWDGLVRPDAIRAALDAGVRIRFLAGDHDQVVKPETYRMVQELIPGVEVDIVEDAPHSMYWEAPELFNAALDRFLESVYTD
jgi:pimeloyl-ACP methyl ester carboxylesterase